MKKTFLFLTTFLVTVLAGSMTAYGDNDDSEKNISVVPPVDTTNNQKSETAVVSTPTPNTTIGWPANYGGVMLQAFYWDSYDDTQWSLLEKQSDELSGTFDLVWIP
jgi:hypothetical protein